MTAMKNGAWLKVYTMDTQRGSNDSPERWSELAQGKVHTIGESIVINSEKDAAGTAGAVFMRMHCKTAAIWKNPPVTRCLPAAAHAIRQHMRPMSTNMMTNPNLR